MTESAKKATKADSQEGRLLRIAAVGDFHCGGHGDSAELAELFSNVDSEADMLLLMGNRRQSEAAVPAAVRRSEPASRQGASQQEQ